MACGSTRCPARPGSLRPVAELARRAGGLLLGREDPEAVPRGSRRVGAEVVDALEIQPIELHVGARGREVLQDLLGVVPALLAVVLEHLVEAVDLGERRLAHLAHRADRLDNPNTLPAP